MAWWGKVLGGSLGFALGGPLGAALGAYIGHNFDSGLKNIEVDEGATSATQQEMIQAAFFSATFTIMGRLAKVDGRVSEKEIENAKVIMARLGLNDTLKQSAIGLFQQGKEDTFDWKAALAQFARVCGRQRNLKQMFLEILVFAAWSDGEIHPAEKEMLLVIAKQLGFSRFFLEKLIISVQAQNYFEQQGYRRAGQSQVNTAQQLEMSYKLLGVESNATDQDIKKAYRRLMSQHHPDKLVAKGLPEEMIKVATEKTQEVKSAYEMIMRERKKVH